MPSAIREIIAEYEKQGKYLSILHEAACDNYLTLNACGKQMLLELS